ncbi:hypothetical protein BT96DRAFT_202221 [Gymnopus androsaceus JB14]|uniref:Uncharacterized protein n=1 Tax=Gymnopus androsaceus JB14 TaxID=1447944 RepID=A0A6A4H833_9AGAR|nr:hypothetical protein BT96DRAFT_202221 [Gymnopus androsaceus JB14]
MTRATGILGSDEEECLAVLCLAVLLPSTEDLGEPAGLSALLAPLLGGASATKYCLCVSSLHGSTSIDLTCPPFFFLPSRHSVILSPIACLIERDIPEPEFDTDALEVLAPSSTQPSLFNHPETLCLYSRVYSYHSKLQGYGKVLMDGLHSRGWIYANEIHSI